MLFHGFRSPAAHSTGGYAYSTATRSEEVGVVRGHPTGEDGGHVGRQSKFYFALSGLEWNIGDIWLPRAALRLPWAVIFCPYRAKVDSCLRRNDRQRSAWGKRTPYALEIFSSLTVGAWLFVGLQGDTLFISISKSDCVDLSHWCQSRSIYAVG